MRTLHFSLLLFLAVPLACVAQDSVSPAATPASHFQMSAQFSDVWQTVRGKQPAGLHLTLTLTKTHYYMGEVIPATLTFSNDTKEIYHVKGSTGGRKGRSENIVFRAEGEGGSPVSDPLDWYYHNYIQMSGGSSHEKHSDPWQISLSANQWLQFGKPGTYQLYAQSSNMAPGERENSHGPWLPGVELVSDPVEITIDPLPPEEEKGIIEQARQTLASANRLEQDGPAFDAIERLRFLQTPAALDALLQYVDSPYTQEAALGFYARPDYPVLAEKILTAVREGRLGLSENLQYLYGNLKSGGFMNSLSAPGDPSPPRAPSLEETARQELIAAASRALSADGAGDAFFTSLFTLFSQNPQDPAVRAILIKRQLDLPQKQIDEGFGLGFRGFRIGGHKKLPTDKAGTMDAKYFPPIPGDKNLLADKDFLPLLRELVKPEKHNPYALEALAFVAPDEARPIILEDLHREHPIYVPTEPHVYFSPADALFALKALPGLEPPALDATLRARLLAQTADEPNLEATVTLIERYGTKALLPDVIRLYQTNEGHWQCVLQASVLRYWIHCDPAAGVEALGRALKKDGKKDTGCFRFVLSDVLQNAWVDEALPLVLAATGNQDRAVVRSATPLLEAHSGPGAVDRVIAAIEREATRPAGKNPADQDERLYDPTELTRLLIDNQRWKPSRPQLERLQKVTTDEALQARLKSMLSETDK